MKVLYVCRIIHNIVIFTFYNFVVSVILQCYIQKNERNNKILINKINFTFSKCD